MSDTLVIEKELKILNVKTVWDRIQPVLKEAREKKTICKIDLGKVESADGAGLQSVLYYKFLEKEFPDNFKITEISETLTEKMKNLGMIPNESEVRE